MKIFDAEVVGGNKVKPRQTDGEPNLRGKNMVFTRPLELGEIIFDADVMDYLAYSIEVGKDGYNHYQGFVCWKCDRWSFAVKKKYGHYFSKMKGKLVQSEDYCSKQDKLVEFGKLPKQGERTDLTKLIGEIKDGRSVDDIVMNDPLMYHQYGRTLNRCEEIVMSQIFRTHETKCNWYIGETGAGKSWKAYEGYSPKTHYNHCLEDNGWWDNYKQQDIVVLNEFRGQLKYSFLLKLLEEHPFDVPRRGRPPVPFTSKLVIITSPMHPKDIYRELDAKDSLTQLIRRVDFFEVKNRVITALPKAVCGNILDLMED